MYSVGDYVVCGNKGVCRVDQISPLDISGASSEDYYILKPVYSPGSTVYISMESADEKLRAVLTKKEADKQKDAKDKDAKTSLQAGINADCVDTPSAKYKTDSLSPSNAAT